MELLVVVTILIVLGLALLMSLNPLTQIIKGYDTRRRSDLNKIKIAFEAYYSDHDCYPDKSVLTQCDSTALQPYINTIPCDPSTKAGYKINVFPTDSTCPQKYAIYASTTSVFNSSTVPGCTNTYAVYSSNMGGLELTKGCSKVTQTCVNVYGCKQGVCTLVAVDEIVKCSPNSCLSNCGANCSLKKPNGSFKYECIDFK